MAHILRRLLSFLYIVQVYVVMAVLGVIFAPFALVSPRGAVTACRLYCRWVFWSARRMLGLEFEVRGNVPDGDVLVAAKHQSFLDILLIFWTLPRAKFVMKRELLWTPFIGLYAKRLGCVPVNRGKRGAAIIKMVKDVGQEVADPGQFVIYPQGTRVAPGSHKSYKIGAAILYEELGKPCIPVATNAGLFWPKRGGMRFPGRALIEFLDPISPGCPRREFMTELEQRIETRSNELLQETGL